MKSQKYALKSGVTFTLILEDLRQQITFRYHKIIEFTHVQTPKHAKVRNLRKDI